MIWTIKRCYKWNIFMPYILLISKIRIYLYHVFHSIRLRLQRLVARESSHFLYIIFYITFDSNIKESFPPQYNYSAAIDLHQIRHK
jgi:hypothetical protein